MNDNKNVFKITTDDGKTVDCEIILTIDSDEFKKQYLVYTDHTYDENGSIKTYASIYDPKGENLDLYPIETDAEWEMIENVLASAQKKVLEEVNEQN